MLIHQALMPDSQLENLSLLVGKLIGPIYSPALQVYDGFLLAPRVSLSLSLTGDEGFLNFKTEHLYKSHIMYWQLSAEKSAWPDNIACPNGSPDLYAKAHISGIYLPQAWYVNEVNIFTAQYDHRPLQGEDVRVEYDAALVLRRHGGSEQFCRSLCIAPRPNGTDQLIVFTEEGIIRKKTRNLQLRRSFS